MATDLGEVNSESKCVKVQIKNWPSDTSYLCRGVAKHINEKMTCKCKVNKQMSYFIVLTEYLFCFLFLIPDVFFLSF